LTLPPNTSGEEAFALRLAAVGLLLLLSLSACGVENRSTTESTLNGSEALSA
jgi:hypothetical protein